MVLFLSFREEEEFRFFVKAFQNLTQIENFMVSIEEVVRMKSLYLGMKEIWLFRGEE